MEVVEVSEAAFNELWAKANNLTLLKVFAEHGYNERAHGSVFADVANWDAWRALVRQSSQASAEGTYRR